MHGLPLWPTFSLLHASATSCWHAILACTQPSTCCFMSACPHSPTCSLPPLSQVKHVLVVEGVGPVVGW
jgi:hypothetical protein